MKGYKNNVVMDKKHSNNDLTIKCGGYQQRMGLKHYKNWQWFIKHVFSIVMTAPSPV